MEEGKEPFYGELWVEGNRIWYVGSEKEKPEYLGKWDREIDAKGNLLMPGFKNAHTHSAMTFLRSYADDYPLQEWLFQKVFPYEAKLTEDDVYQLSKLAIMEYLTSGMTANFDMYLFPREIARASVDCGFRTVLTSGLNDFGPELSVLDKLYQDLNDYHELITFMIGFHAEYTTKKELLEGVAALAHKYQSPLFVHNSETASEVEGCVKRYGMTPTCLMESLGMFEYGGGGYHCVHMSDQDLEIFRNRNLSVVTNPASNVKLASGIARIKDMLDRGINIAIGTDGPASNNCLDMFREMFLVTGLAKIREKDASCVPADQVLRMAAVGGARAMGLKDCDMLAEGKLADLIMINLNQPNMQPINNIVKNLVYAGSKQNVALTMVNGKVLYENGQFHIGVDAEEVYERVNRIVKEKFA